jgi:hypothetical protein
MLQIDWTKSLFTNIKMLSMMFLLTYEKMQAWWKSIDFFIWFVLEFTLLHFHYIFSKLLLEVNQFNDVFNITNNQLQKLFIYLFQMQNRKFSKTSKYAFRCCWWYFSHFLITPQANIKAINWNVSDWRSETPIFNEKSFLIMLLLNMWKIHVDGKIKWYLYLISIRDYFLHLHYIYLENSYWKLDNWMMLQIFQKIKDRNCLFICFIMQDLKISRTLRIYFSMLLMTIFSFLVAQQIKIKAFNKMLQIDKMKQLFLNMKISLMMFLLNVQKMQMHWK